LHCLRVINALEKVRSSKELLVDKVLEARELSEARQPLRIANAEIGHGIRVLQEVKLPGAAVVHLKAARTLLVAAGKTQLALARNALVRLAVKQLEKAREDMV
jgi:hypothetical protein